MKQDSKIWAANKYGVPEDSVIAYNSGICYDRIWVNSKESADTISAKVTGTVNGGMFDGMPLGNIQKHNDGTYVIMC